MFVEKEEYILTKLELAFFLEYVVHLPRIREETHRMGTFKGLIL